MRQLTEIDHVNSVTSISFSFDSRRIVTARLTGVGLFLTGVVAILVHIRSLDHVKDNSINGS